MRLNRIRQLCRNNKTVYIFETIEAMTGEVLQVISDGENCFPLIGFPILDEETCLLVLDIPKSDRDNWTVRICRRDRDRELMAELFEEKISDIPLKLTPLTIEADHEYKALQTSIGQVYFAELNAINVVEAGDNPPTWYLRILPDDREMIVAKRGMLGIEAVCSCIYPDAETYRMLQKIVAEARL